MTSQWVSGLIGGCVDQLKNGYVVECKYGHWLLSARLTSPFDECW